MPPISPRSPFGQVGLPGDNMMTGFMSQYVNNWSAVQQALAEAGIDAELLAAIQNQGFGAPVAGDTTIINEAPRGERARAAGTPTRGFTGGGYARNPGQINGGLGKWGAVIGALNGGGNPERAARRAARGAEDGVVVVPGKERTRTRERSRTSKDGTTTTTSVHISRNGGTAISDQSGGDGNRSGRRKKRGY